MSNNSSPLSSVSSSPSPPSPKQRQSSSSLSGSSDESSTEESASASKRSRGAAKEWNAYKSSSPDLDEEVESEVDERMTKRKKRAREEEEDDESYDEKKFNDRQKKSRAQVASDGDSGDEGGGHGGSKRRGNVSEAKKAGSSKVHNSFNVKPSPKNVHRPIPPQLQKSAQERPVLGDSKQRTRKVTLGPLKNLPVASSESAPPPTTLTSSKFPFTGSIAGGTPKLSLPSSRPIPPKPKPPAGAQAPRNNANAMFDSLFKRPTPVTANPPKANEGGSQKKPPQTQSKMKDTDKEKERMGKVKAEQKDHTMTTGQDKEKEKEKAKPPDKIQEAPKYDPITTELNALKIKKTNPADVPAEKTKKPPRVASEITSQHKLDRLYARIPPTATPEVQNIRHEVKQVRRELARETMDLMSTPLEMAKMEEEFRNYVRGLEPRLPSGTFGIQILQRIGQRGSDEVYDREGYERERYGQGYGYGQGRDRR